LLQTPDTLTLERALERARATRPQLQAAQALTAGARARVGIAGTIPNPILTFKHSETSPIEDASISQPLDWLLTRGANRAAARAGLLGAEADSALIAAQVGYEVRVAFYTSLAASESWRLVAAQAATADSLVAFAAERVRAGDISVLEREQFEVEAGRVFQLGLRSYEARLAAAISLRRVLGGAITTLVPVGRLDRGLDITLPIGDQGLGSPLLQRAVADSAAQRALSQASALRRIPFPSLMLGREWDADGPFANGSRAVIGFSIPVPIWNIGTGPASLARAQVDQAAANLAETRLELSRQVADAELRLGTARSRAVFTRDSLLPRAQRLRDGAVRLYRAGQTGVIPLFDALRAEREVAIGYIDDLLAWQRALADWLLLLGRSE
ncbi:MAG: TolC family protein, partial [Gemmatimonadota bacterium]|nr:TolC family protein [Gemmatimonadota bacterium]